MRPSRVPAMSRIAGIAALGAATLLSACAVGPDFKPAEAPAGADYTPKPLPAKTDSAKVHGGEAERFAIGHDIQFDWWTLFRSPALDALVQQAFKANPTIDAAEAALKQAQEQVYAQQGFFYPNLQAGYQGERQQLSGNTANSGEIGFQGNGRQITQRYNAQPVTWTFHTVGLTVGFVPDVFGLNRRTVESLQAQADNQRFQLEATYITLASNVVAAALQEASTRAQIAATKEIIRVNKEGLDILLHQQRVGYAMGIDVAAQEASLAAAEALLPPLEKQYEQTRDLIRALVGNLPNQDVPQTFELDAIQLPVELPVSLPSALVEQRPDVRAAEEMAHAASAEVGVALANMLPQFNINAAAGGGATLLGQMFSPGGPFWNFGWGVTQPLFEGFTLLHRKRAADEALRQAVDQYPQHGHNGVPERCRHAACGGFRFHRAEDRGRCRACGEGDARPHGKAGTQRLRELSHAAAGHPGLSDRGVDAGAGAGDPFRRRRGAVPGAGRRLVAPRGTKGGVQVRGPWASGPWQVQGGALVGSGAKPRRRFTAAAGGATLPCHVVARCVHPRRQ